MILVVMVRLGAVGRAVVHVDQSAKHGGAGWLTAVAVHHLKDFVRPFLLVFFFELENFHAALDAVGLGQQSHILWFGQVAHGIADLQARHGNFIGLAMKDTDGILGAVLKVLNLAVDLPQHNIAKDINQLKYLVALLIAEAHPILSGDLMSGQELYKVLLQSF